MLHVGGKGLLPQVGRLATLNNFLNALGCGRVNCLGQVVRGEKCLFGNFAVWRRNCGLAPGSHNEESDVVAWEGVVVGVNPKKFGAAFEDDTRFLVEFPRKCHHDRFAFFDAAAREVPAWPVGMADQENAVAGVEDAPLGPKRQSA